VPPDSPDDDRRFEQCVPDVDVEARSDRLLRRGGHAARRPAGEATASRRRTRLRSRGRRRPELGQLRQQCLEALRADYRIDPEAGGRSDDERAILDEARGLARAWSQAAVAG
jgi:hypothetical protein